ncbi:hypothetical protein ACIB24_21020 [Spongisporangium articulatum]|uniref:Membrane protein involved in the export of O-antigen and teichoic acid n=1 Tax=Spongisporangium articulatum TaxID=3362603 RepID=A0ABW8AT43_9ACTN
MIADLARRVLGFAAVPALSILSPLLVTPLVAAKFGAGGWSSVAVGQSVGGAASVVMALSWPTIGAHLIASEPDPGRRRHIYQESFVTRAVAFAVVGPLAFLAAWLVSPAHPVNAGATALGITLNGFTCAWYFVGVSSVRGLVINESVLRLACSVAIAGLLFAGADLWVFGWVTVASWVISIGLNHRTIAGREPPLRPTRALLRTTLAAQGFGTVARTVYGMYYLGTAGLVALVAPGAVAVYAVFDRIIVIGLNGLFALPQAVAGWISSGGPAAVTARARRVTAVGAGLALLALPVAYFAFPLVIHLLYAGEATWTTAQQFVASVLFAAAFLNRGLVLTLLVPQGRESAVYTGYVLSAVLGVPLLLGLAVAFGATGALAAVALVDITLTTWMLVAGLRGGVRRDRQLGQQRAQDQQERQVQDERSPDHDRGAHPPVRT